MKKIISILVTSVLMLMLLSPLTVIAADNRVVVDGVIFSSDMRTLIEYPSEKKDKHYTIPDGVTSIGDFAFEDTSLKSVSIPDSVTSIGKRAFSDCPGLADGAGFVIIRNVLYGYFGNDTIVTIPDDVTSIEGYAFSKTEKLSNIIIPNSVTTLKSEAFACCRFLGDIIIPDSVTYIGDLVFYDCKSLTSVTIPSSAGFIFWYSS